MDFKKLSEVGAQKIADTKKPAPKTNQVTDSERKARIEAIRKRLADSRKYKKFSITDGYKNLKKKIKDEFDETETTEQAVEVAIETLAEQPAEQVVAAVIEVLGDVIDELSEAPVDDTVTEK